MGVFVALTGLAVAWTISDQAHRDAVNVSASETRAVLHTLGATSVQDGPVAEGVQAVIVGRFPDATATVVIGDPDKIYRYDDRRLHAGLRVCTNFAVAVTPVGEATRETGRLEAEFSRRAVPGAHCG